MIYELRIYHAMPGKMPALIDRFEKHTGPLFKELGMECVGYWTEAVGDSSKFYYMMRFKDQGDMEKKWQSFRDCGKWPAIAATTEKDGPLISKAVNTVLRPTRYSPMK